MVTNRQHGLEPCFDREKLLQAEKPAARQSMDHERQVDVRAMPLRTAAHGAEDGARGKREP